MADVESPHVRLQQQVDCQLEVKPKDALAAWEKNGWNEEPGTDADEAPLKYVALVLLDAIEERAAKLTIDKDQGPTVYAEQTYTLPKAPAHLIARGLEIVREIAGIGDPTGKGTLSLGVRSDSLDLTIDKAAGLHTFTMPGVGYQ
jgi:hypothetical protein